MIDARTARFIVVIYQQRSIIRGKNETQEPRQKAAHSIGTDIPECEEAEILGPYSVGIRMGMQRLGWWCCSRIPAISFSWQRKWVNGFRPGSLSWGVVCHETDKDLNHREIN